jgi:DNA transformation protein
MSVQPQYLAYILEQLDGLKDLRSRRMFGGVGLYSGELFFGLVDDDTLFFKTDSTNSAEYIARKMPRFMPFPDRPEAVMAYYQVPADIIEDAEALGSWARNSVAVALTSRAAKARPAKKKAPRKARKKARKTTHGKARKRATRAKKKSPTRRAKRR